MSGLLLPKQVRIRDRAHKKRIVALGCCVPSCICSFLRFKDPWVRAQYEGAIHPHHVRIGAGTALKPGDDCCVPLSWRHHHEIHQIGARSFERKYSLDLMAIARALRAETLEIRSRDDHHTAA